MLAWRYPMQDMEIQNGAKLTVRESQMAAFVNEGRMADVLGAGPVHAQHANAAAADEPHELGQAVPVAVQERRLLLLHAPADESALGHGAAGHRFATRISARSGLRAFGIYSWRADRSAHVSHEGQRHARALPRRGSRRPTSQHDRRPHVGHVRREQGAVPRHGGQPDRARRSGSPSICSPRSPISD